VSIVDIHGHSSTAVVNVTNSTGSPRPTRDCGAPISSKKGCVTCSRSKVKKANRRSTGGRAGARRSRLPAFVQLQRRIAAHRPAIDAALDTGLSQGLVESTNTKVRLLTRIAFGFHGYEPLVALAMLALGSHPPRLPGRE
jgi:transposase